MLLISAGLPAFGLWMPWATESDKIRKTIDEVWRALLTGNRAALMENLVTGPSSKIFIEQELDYIRKMRVGNFHFRFRNIKIDRVKNEWAWVSLDKIATLPYGAKQTTSTVMVFKKEDGFWKLYTNPKTMKKRRQERLEGQETMDTAKVDRNKAPQAAPSSGFQWTKGPPTKQAREKTLKESKATNPPGFTAKAIDKDNQAPKPGDNPVKAAAWQPPPKGKKKAFFKWEKEPVKQKKAWGKPQMKANKPVPSKESSGGWTVEKGPAPKPAEVAGRN